MTITINTDASYHPEFKVAAFSFWIVCSRKRLIKAGPLKSVKNAQDAELQSIGNALHVVLENFSFDVVEHIYINTDCKYGIDAVTKGKKMNKCEETVRKIHSIIGKLQKKHNYKSGKFKSFISWRYVKAHSEGEDSRRWVNNRMDVMAKQELWKQINTIKHLAR